MSRLIDADKLCEYARNQVSRSVDANDIMRFPTVDAEPVRHGHWIEHSSWYIVYSCECSECGQVIKNLYYNLDRESAIENAGLYCKRCGAKMDGVEG